MTLDVLVGVRYPVAIPKGDRTSLGEWITPDVLSLGYPRVCELPAGDGIGDGVCVGGPGHSRQFTTRPGRSHSHEVHLSLSVSVGDEEQVFVVQPGRAQVHVFVLGDPHPLPAFGICDPDCGGRHVEVRDPGGIPVHVCNPITIR